PLTVYEDYLPYIEKMARGEKNILTSHEVLLFEPTSGSVSASKLIPCTAALKAEFQQGIKAWLYDLYAHLPGLADGRGYWSVTPAAFTRRRTEGGVTVGFESDEQYLGRAFECLSRLVLVKPKPGGDFYLRTAEALAACRNLTLVSVWNPSLFILILENMENNGMAVADHFSRLKLISCWGDASAAAYAQKLSVRFPGVLIQPKGLIATEAFISFPLLGEEGARLAVTSHFFEFLSLADGRIYLAHELEAGERYEAVVTTSGGLYRYRMGDIVLVLDAGEAPRLRFLGRNGKVSDLFGEKLNELFVSEVLADLLEKWEMSGEFCMLAPETDRYVLYIQSARLSGAAPAGQAADGLAARLAEDLESGLARNCHYEYCRTLGQLKPLALYRLSGHPFREYLERAAERGQRPGDVKPPALSLEGGWDKVFTGGYL
ncbi:MAG: GH3 auxin-responsive promoter family protein, partial [Gracilibacteraceae bacterium]|nr:GH3 auxin-responsive promoter family protein [Gracilibacteraceae bacterium]